MKIRDYSFRQKLRALSSHCKPGIKYTLKASVRWPFFAPTEWFRINYCSFIFNGKFFCEYDPPPRAEYDVFDFQTFMCHLPISLAELMLDINNLEEL